MYKKSEVLLSLRFLLLRLSEKFFNNHWKTIAFFIIWVYNMNNASRKKSFYEFLQIKNTRQHLKKLEEK